MKIIFLFKDEDIEEFQCLLPNGILLDICLNVDFELRKVKDLVIYKATTDGKQLSTISFAIIIE